jgi:hypothetical protein
MGTKGFVSVGGLGGTGTGVRGDRELANKETGMRGMDTWNADIPNRKRVRNHTLLASSLSVPAGTVWSLLLSLCIFVVVFE